ncbi:hypothetical protein KIS4809_0596 [Bacillus sp. ZZV12-4809]|nr:hypothetical protein KIS4809_0596 [Bacillus sp. ZZV12-4809]
MKAANLTSLLLFFYLVTGIHALVVGGCILYQRHSFSQED